MNELEQGIYCFRCRKDLTVDDFRDKNEVNDFKVYGLCPVCMSAIQPDKE